MSKSPFQKFKESGPTFLHITQKPGVYYILNTFNNCMYIGQSWRIGDRWLTHVNALNAGKHTNKALQRDWNAFGARDFEFGTLVTYEPPMRPTTDPTPWGRTPLPLSAQQAATIHDLDATTKLAYGLARAAGASVAILEGRGGYWIACPADLAAYWAEDLRSGRARVVNTVDYQNAAPVEV